MKEFLDRALKPVESVCNDFPWDNKNAYGNYLAQIYYYVCHSTRLLALAATRCAHKDEKLHRRFLEHAAEEKGHQILALNDLKNLGYTLSDFPELPITSFMYESQYYKIEYQDPNAFFGYILALEGITVKKGAQIYNTVFSTFGKKSSTFLDVHAHEDPDHLAKAFLQLENLSELQKKFIYQNIKQTAEGFQNMLLECARQAQYRKSA